MNKAHLPQAGRTLEIEDVLARDARTRDIHADVVFMPDTPDRRASDTGARP